MANPYKNYQLYRALPKLSGNMQLDLILDFGKNPLTGSICGNVQQAHLRPLSKLVNFAPVADERLMDRPHHLNIKKFYEKTRAGFYEQCIDPSLASDWPMMVSAAEMPDLKYIRQFDDTYFAGCQRMSHKLYGCTHELLVPVWLDHCYGLRFHIKVADQKPSLIQPTKVNVSTVTLDLSKVYLAGPQYCPKFHNDFTKYLMEYFDYVHITEGSADVMSIDFSQNYATISGLLVESGNYTTRQNLNITRNLIYRERPLLESNSMLTNTFMDYKMIATQLINFNLCFDLDKLLRATGNYGKSRVNVWCDVEAITARKDEMAVYFDEPDFAAGTGWLRKSLPKADFYTNHHYLPKQRIECIVGNDLPTYGKNDYTYPRNVLDYKRDFDCTDLMHCNKMSQSICHWYYAQEPEDMLFNVYDGFGAYSAQGEYNHGYGPSVDLDNSEYDEELDNTLWAGNPRILNEQDVYDILANPWKYVRNGFFNDTSGYINGTKFNFNAASVITSPNSKMNAPSKIYMGVGKTPTDSGIFATWTAGTTFIGDLTTIAIITDRCSAGTTRKPGDLPKTQSDEALGSRDLLMDWHEFSDMDNRYVIKKAGTNLRAYFDPTGEYLQKGKYIWLDPNVDPTAVIPRADYYAYKTDYNGDLTRAMLCRIGGTGDVDASFRNDTTINGLFVTMMRVALEGEEKSKDDPLFVIFWTKHTMNKTDLESGLIPRELTADAITQGGIAEALQNYWTKYKPITEIINEMVENGEIDDPDTPGGMDDLGTITNLMTGLERPELIYFHNSIRPGQDITLSIRAQEHNYYKTSSVNEYVQRYSGAIKPAIYPVNYKNSPRVYRDIDTHELRFRGWYGRNFLWRKEPIFAIGQAMPPNLSKYINKNIAPKYPSLDYEVVLPYTVEGNDEMRDTINYYGDMIYTEIPPVYLGLRSDYKSLFDIHVSDFGFEVDDTEHKFSFSASVLGNKINLNSSKNDYIRFPEVLNYPDSYSNLAREAVLNSRFDLSHLINRTTNDIGYWLYKPEYETYEWPEIKWFDESYIINMPEKIVFDGNNMVEVANNDKAELERVALQKILAQIKVPSDPDTNKSPSVIDMAYLRRIYDIKYDLQAIQPENNTTLYKHKYIVTATLK